MFVPVVPIEMLVLEVLLDATQGGRLLCCVDLYQM
jgi:hypothetical protein